MLIEMVENKDDNSFTELIGKRVTDRDGHEHLVVGVRKCIMLNPMKFTDHFKLCFGCKSNGTVLIPEWGGSGLCGGKWFIIE